MKTSFINSILNSQPILKFALKLFECKCQSFQTHLLLDLHFSLNSHTLVYAYVNLLVFMHIAVLYRPQVVYIGVNTI